MKKILPLLALLLTALPTLARLGETKAECEKRYGKPVRTSEQSAFYKKGDMEITIFFWKEKASSVRYQKAGPAGGAAGDKKGRQLTETELTVLLDANKGTSTWEKPDSDENGSAWERADNGAMAYYHVHTASFSIQASDYIDHMSKEREKAEAEKSRNETKKLDGF